MDLVPHQRTKALVNQLVPGNGPLARKNVGHDQRLEMCVVGAGDPNYCVIKTGFNKPFNLGGLHGARIFSGWEGAQCTRIFRGFPMPRADCV